MRGSGFAVWAFVESLRSTVATEFVQRGPGSFLRVVAHFVAGLPMRFFLHAGSSVEFPCIGRDLRIGPEICCPGLNRLTHRLPNGFLKTLDDDPACVHQREHLQPCFRVQVYTALSMNTWAAGVREH